MTILPKKKPASTAGGGDHTDEPDRRGSSESHPHPLAGRSVSRPRASPPPWTYQATPHTSREERRIEASARPQQASPQPGAAGAPVAQCEGNANSVVVAGRVELPCGTGGVGSCCSGPGLSKRRRQAVCSSGLTGGGGRAGGGGGGGSPVSEPEEGAGGNNSEDEYENAARLQVVDPATVEQYADQCLMKNAIKTSEESWIEQQMLEDKKRATDWEATNEAIEEQVARESYLQWLQDQEKQARQPRKASATCSSATAATSSGFEDWGCRSPRQRSSAPSPEHPGPAHPEPSVKPPSPAGASLVLPKPPSPCAPGPSHQSSANSSLVSLYPALGYRTLMQDMSPTAFGLTDWEDDDVLASVLAASQQEYLDNLKKNTMHRESSPDCS
uniref:OTU deubiquitinase 5b n=1 Tax=Cyprinus carpio TaxID=7962 RepID=A0A8C1XCK1_CYPCA